MAFRESTPQPEIFDGMFASVPPNETLRCLNQIIDWGRLRGLFSSAYDSKGVGHPGFDPVMLSKLLLLESIYNLSDVRVCQEAADRLSFREFLGIGGGDRVPDDSTLVRFRKRLSKHQLDDKVQDFFHQELARHGLAMKPGAIAIIDASLIDASTRPPRKEKDSKGDGDEKANEGKPERRDGEATSTKKNGEWHFGFKLHMMQRAATGIIESQKITTASLHDTNVFEELLRGTEKAVLADKGYDSKERSKWLCERGIGDYIMIKKKRGESEKSSEWKRQFNKVISPMRSGIEKTFAILKRWRGCAKARYLGLKKVQCQINWAVTSHNLLIMIGMMKKSV